MLHGQKWGDSDLRPSDSNQFSSNSLLKNPHRTPPAAATFIFCVWRPPQTAGSWVAPHRNTVQNLLRQVDEEEAAKVDSQAAPTGEDGSAELHRSVDVQWCHSQIKHQ